MSRTLLTLLAGLAAGVANAGPDHADHKQGDHKAKTAHSEPHAEHAKAEHKTLAELFPDEQKPELWIGSKAPALKLAHFPRGEAITSFEPGQTYVVEMWATWCGPCIAAFPHVASLQEKYGDKLSVIGVNIWEQAKGDERVELVNKFVAKHTEMKYTVAIEEGTSMADTWMKPAGRGGIPAAFIVNGEGKVAWMGHPMAMDEPLDQIINGGYDLEAIKRKKWLGHLTSVAWDQMLIASSAGEYERLVEVCKTLVYDAYNDGAQPLNFIAWRLLGYEDATPGVLTIAREAARRACELTEWKDWAILDTYALAEFRNADADSAAKWQRRAIELAPEASKDELRPQLKRYLGEG